MALVRVIQAFVMEGYSELKEESFLFFRRKNVREKIKLYTWVECICDESEAIVCIEEKIKEKMRTQEAWGKDFEGWSSYRKYCTPGELEKYPDGIEYKLNMEYIRDWKMEKIIKELDATQFAILCKEVGISSEDAIKIK